MSKKPPIPDPYYVDYAPTGRASCKVCKCIIEKDTVRFCRKVHSPFHDGIDVQYTHFECCKKWATGIAEISEWEGLKWSDIEECLEVFEIDMSELEDHALMKEEKKRNEMFWNLKAAVQTVPAAGFQSTLTANGRGTDKPKHPLAAHIVADGLLFGKLPACPMCENDTLMQNGPVIRCFGHMGGSIRCAYKYRMFNMLDPDESVDEVNKDMTPIERTEKFTCDLPAKAMSKIKVPKDAPSNSLGSGDGTKTKVKQSSGKRARVEFDSETEDVPEGEELAGIVFSIIGKTDPPKSDLVDIIEQHGGSYKDALDGNTTYLLAGDPKAKTTKRYQEAVAMGIAVLHFDFVESLVSRTNVEGEDKKKKKKATEDEEDTRPKGLLLRQRKYAKAYLLGGEVSKKLPSAAAAVAEAEKENEEMMEMRPKIRVGSELLKLEPEACHIQNGKIFIDEYGNAFNAMLNQTNLETGVNRFYALQLIVSGTPKSKKKGVHLLRKWGRIGESGNKNGHLIDTFEAIEHAIQDFTKRFTEFTGVSWNDRFTKSQQPNKMRVMEKEGYLWEGEEDTTATPVGGSPDSVPSSMQEDETTLHEQLFSLIELIFSRDLMAKLMAERDMDLKKMPLGSISQRQINDGYAALCELQSMLQSDEAASPKNETHYKRKLLAATNKFYDIIPHIFKTTPPTIDTMEKLREKISAIEDLLGIAEQDSLIKKQKEKKSSTMHPVDQRYLGLECELENLSSKHPDYILAKAMVRNTHSTHHSSFGIKLHSVFRVDRKIETDRFVKDKNRMLLWHGSRLTNWVGILSQGLRIAPPEAPVSGYMFDKGVYFADMSSKSAGYCCVSGADHGLLILCEVALGENAYVRYNSDSNAAKNSKKEGKTHTYAIGGLRPDPKKDKKIKSVVDSESVVACTGAPIKHCKETTSLMHNEYIVYDIARVKIRYLLRVSFPRRGVNDAPSVGSASSASASASDESDEDEEDEEDESEDESEEESVSDE